MKTIGLIGGMSWESSIEYYRIINEATKAQLGGLHSAKSVMVSVDFAEIEAMQHAGDWESAGLAMAAAARQCEAGGADFVVLCTNTMHKLAPAIQNAITVPFLHIADATAVRIQQAGMQTVGLLGTRFTMEEAFYRGHMETEHGLNVLIPPAADRAIVHRSIYEELVLGKIVEASRREFLRIIDDLHAAGAEAVIEGCTEIVLLVQQPHTAVPLFDTTRIHAEEAVAMALTK